MRVSSHWHVASRDESLWKSLLRRDCLTAVDAALLEGAKYDCYGRYRDYSKQRDSVLNSVMVEGVKNNSSLASLCYYGRFDSLVEYFADVTKIPKISEFHYYRDAWIYYGNFHSSSEHGYITLAHNGGSSYFSLRSIGESDSYDDDTDDSESLASQTIPTWKGTLLHYACLRGHLDCVQYLLSLAPDAIDLKMPGSEYRAIDIAKVNHHSSLVAYLRTKS